MRNGSQKGTVVPPPAKDGNYDQDFGFYYNVGPSAVTFLTVPCPGID